MTVYIQIDATGRILGTYSLTDEQVMQQQRVFARHQFMPLDKLRALENIGGVFYAFFMVDGREQRVAVDSDSWHWLLNERRDALTWRDDAVSFAFEVA